MEEAVELNIYHTMDCLLQYSSCIREKAGCGWFLGRECRKNMPATVDSCRCRVPKVPLKDGD
jgi:hypothetical protein